MKFNGAEDCVPCMRRKECLLESEKTKVRPVFFLQGKGDSQDNFAEEMQLKTDSDIGREMITCCFATTKCYEFEFGDAQWN
ncbi:MAG: hypothetical protein A4S08_12825 [Proteobacteria bacterium SG_bin4]|nr:MAG: hypothetical protein A4S08_12825 [Proteobacteria bacterium SG_bin4]